MPSSIVADAERRMIEQCGMPFPIAEDSKSRVHESWLMAGKTVEKTIPLSLLVATQRDFDAAKVQSMLADAVDDDEPIDVVMKDGRYHIEDGHHRALAAKFAGRGSVNARIAGG